MPAALGTGEDVGVAVAVAVSVPEAARNLLPTLPASALPPNKREVHPRTAGSKRRRDNARLVAEPNIYHSVAGERPRLARREQLEARAGEVGRFGHLHVRD